jgi:hypothetical protein
LEGEIMAAITRDTYNQSFAGESARRGGFPVIGWLIVLAIAFGVIYSAHAVVQHGSEAVAVRKCLDSNGPMMTFKHKSEPIWYLLCKLNDGRFGIQAVLKSGHEKTAFIPRDGSFKQVMDYIESFATRFKGALPW